VLHQGPQFVDRLQTMRIPQGTLADLSFGVRRKKWEVYANVVNIFNHKLYTRGVTELLIGPKFPQSFDITMTRKF
jgi:outer membrane receptor protein involved in Fe transport